MLRVRQAMDAIGESVPDWQIMTALANGLGCQWEYESANDVQAEIMKLLPGYYNLGQPKKVVPTADKYLSNGYAAALAGRYKGAQPDGPRPFTLLMGQLLYHSGKLSTSAPGLNQNCAQYRPAANESGRYGAIRIEGRCVGQTHIRPWFTSVGRADGPDRRASDMFLSGTFQRTARERSHDRSNR